MDINDIDDSLYKEQIKINKFRLDDECVNQPNNFLYWSDMLSEARREEAEYKRERAIIRANVELKLRRNPPEGFKITEKSILAALEADQKVIEIEEKVINSFYLVKKLEGIVESFKQKKKDIDNLVQLYGFGYFSLPEGSKRGNDHEFREYKKQMAVSHSRNKK